MGLYIDFDSKGNQLPRTGKASALIADGAKMVKELKFQPNLVCVVANGPFDAAGYCHSEAEFRAFNQPDDTRTKVWLVYEYAKLLAE